MCSFGVAIKRTEAERTVPQAYFYVLQEQYLDWCVYFALYGSNSKRSEQKSTEAWILFFCVVLAEFSVCIFHSVYRISTKALEILFDFPLRAQVEFNVNLDFCFFLLFFCAISFSHYFFFLRSYASLHRRQFTYRYIYLWFVPWTIFFFFFFLSIHSVLVIDARTKSINISMSIHFSFLLQDGDRHRKPIHLHIYDDIHTAGSSSVLQE